MTLERSLFHFCGDEIEISGPVVLPSAPCGSQPAQQLGAVTVALDLWQRDGGKSDLLTLVDKAIDTLAEGTRELR